MSDTQSGPESSDSTENLPLASMPAVTEQDKEYGSHAFSEFQKKDYESSFQTLEKLLQARPSDPKAIHNKAVVEFYRTGCKNTDELKQYLGQVCSMYSHVNIDDVDTLDDVDQCILYYNHAVILYYLKQHSRSVNVMDRLFQFMEPLEESLSKKAMFFLVELYLSTYQPEKAMGMIAYIEKHHPSNGNRSQHTPDKGSESSAPDTSTDALKTEISQYKVRCYILLKSMKPCKREVKSLMNTVGMVPSVVYLKSYFEYLRGNYRKAIKLLSSCGSSNLTEENQNMTTMYYNNVACIHFRMKKHNLGTFYLKKAIQANQNHVKDLPKIETDKSLSGRALQSMACSKHHEILYNMGIQLLHCGKPLVAFECLVQIVQLYQTNPRLWLRLAECCVMAHRKDNEEDRRLEERLKVVHGTVGSGIHRKLLLGTGLQQDNTSTASAAMPMATLQFAALCLRNADALLQPGPVSVLSSGSDSEYSEISKPAEVKPVAAPPCNPVRPNEVYSMRCSVLANSAYVALCLNDYSQALNYAEQLVTQPRLSGAHRYLGHMYIAESLKKMDRIADCIANLVPESVIDVSTQIPELKQDATEKSDREVLENVESTGSLHPWFPKDAVQAKAVLLHNLACAHAIRGEYEKALHNLTLSTQNIGQPLPAHVYFLRLYLDLMEGRKKTAQNIIKEHFGHVTPNRPVQQVQQSWS